MSQFAFFNDMNSALKMDDPLSRGPLPRWQKKRLDASESSMNMSLNTSKSKNLQLPSNSKTPKKVNPSENTSPSKTPGKTPKRTPGKGTTPGKSTKTPNGGDRFIPTRSASNFDLGHFKINQAPPEEVLSPTLAEKQRAMAENLHGCDVSKARILAFQTKVPPPPDGYQNALKVVYSQSKTPFSSKVTSRYIPQAPDRILDAPDIVDDYYLNLIDWSQGNILAVGLGCSVYLWNASTGTINHLLDLEGADYVSSVSWISEGEMLAVGTSLGAVQLWDTEQVKRLRCMDGQSARVGCLSWNSYILSSGCRSGLIVHHDVRQRDHITATVSAHTHEVCGLKWSADGRYLASGGNDNMLNIWPVATGNSYSQSTPLHAWSAHQAAVKALAWCPWQNNILASGGGTADRHIRFWNVNSGAMLNSVDTNSQVCGLVWSNDYREIVSGHGYAHNQLSIWKYPSLVKTAELTGHSARVLHLALSPDGTTVLSAGADETLRLWKCFPPLPAKKKETVDSKVAADSIFKKGSIR